MVKVFFLVTQFMQWLFKERAILQSLWSSRFTVQIIQVYFKKNYKATLCRYLKMHGKLFNTISLTRYSLNSNE
jgi:hypothetical protein